MPAQSDAPEINTMRTRVSLAVAQLLFAAILGAHWPAALVARTQGIPFAVLAVLTLAPVLMPGRQAGASWFVAALCLSGLAVLLHAVLGFPAVEPWMLCEFFLLIVTASYAPSVPKMALLSSLVAGAYALALHRFSAFGGEYVWGLPVLLCLLMAFTGKACAAQSRLSRLTETEEQARSKTMTDALTGLPNRAQFLERVARSIQCGVADRSFHFAVLFIDLDGFKPINDGLGHKAGDAVLRHTAKRFQACMRKGDIVGRYGGDEFTLLINQVTGEADAIRVAERILAKLKDPIDVGEPVTVGASIGIALSSNLHECPEDLIRDADGAMYRAKMQGKNRYVLSDQARDIPKDELKERLRRVARARW